MIHTLELVVDGLARRAVIHEPQRDGPLPVVLLLHGSGGSGEWALRETRFDERDEFLVVAPDATRPDPTLPARFYTNPAVWNDGTQHPPVDRVRHIDDVAFIAALIDELPRRWNVDQKRIHATGFSNGAGMTFRLARELSDRLAAVAPVAGHLPPGDVKPTRPVPTLYLTGTHDPLIPLAGGVVATPWMDGAVKPTVRDTLSRWATALGLPAEPSLMEVTGGVRREAWTGDLLEARFIDGLGHHWPGGRAGLNPRIAGPATSTVDATAAIAAFFSDARQ